MGTGIAISGASHGALSSILLVDRSGGPFDRNSAAFSAESVHSVQAGGQSREDSFCFLVFRPDLMFGLGIEGFGGSSFSMSFSH